MHLGGDGQNEELEVKNTHLPVSPLWMFLPTHVCKLEMYINPEKNYNNSKISALLSPQVMTEECRRRYGLKFSHGTTASALYTLPFVCVFVNLCVCCQSTQIWSLSAAPQNTPRTQAADSCHSSSFHKESQVSPVRHACSDLCTFAGLPLSMCDWAESSDM